MEGFSGIGILDRLISSCLAYKELCEKDSSNSEYLICIPMSYLVISRSIRKKVTFKSRGHPFNNGLGFDPPGANKLVNLRVFFSQYINNTTSVSKVQRQYFKHIFFYI